MPILCMKQFTFQVISLYFHVSIDNEQSLPEKNWQHLKSFLFLLFMSCLINSVYLSLFSAISLFEKMLDRVYNFPWLAYYHQAFSLMYKLQILTVITNLCFHTEEKKIDNLRKCKMKWLNEFALPILLVSILSMSIMVAW